LSNEIQTTVIWNTGTAGKLLEACRLALPYECCGLLIGRSGNEDTLAMVTGFRVMRNASSRPGEHFEFDPQEWVELLYKNDPASGRAADMIGIFHSHPQAPAVPSEEDLAIQWEFPVYAILSLEHDNTPSLRCYRPHASRSWEEQAVMFRNG
jgi:[CysO sulfur-carrier protein]-S-L-cysteine hydrolase